MKLLCSAISKFLASYCSPAYISLYLLADIIEIWFMKAFLYIDEYDVDFTASVTMCITQALHNNIAGCTKVMPE